jgi:2-polyprenyl-3-methyl-5-hydroxy-6-metoxy-1,4-benzoquinol methylase
VHAVIANRHEVMARYARMLRQAFRQDAKQAHAVVFDKPLLAQVYRLLRRGPGFVTGDQAASLALFLHHRGALLQLQQLRTELAELCSASMRHRKNCWPTCASGASGSSVPASPRCGNSPFSYVATPECLDESQTLLACFVHHSWRLLRHPTHVSSNERLALSYPVETLLTQRTHCPACNHTSFRLVHREPLDSPGVDRYMREHYQDRVTRQFAGHHYELMACQSCEMAFQAHVPSEELLAEIYDKWVPQVEREAYAMALPFSTYRYLSDQVQFMMQLFPQPPHTVKVFDFGFGWGEWMKMAAGYGCNVSGAELSHARADHARSLGFQVVEGNALPREEYHFINTEQVFEHLVDPLTTLQGLATALRPGGVIKICVPDSASSLRKIERARDFSRLSKDDIMAIAPFEHINSFTHRSLVALGASAGLVPLRMPLRKLYNAASGWFEPKNAVRMLLRPIYRHVYPKSTMMYFTRPR